MRIGLRAGRRFEGRDDARAQQVVVVNEEFARLHFPGESPVGKRLEIGMSEPPRWRTIVGVAANVKNLGVDKPSRVQVYGSYLQGPTVIPGLAPSFSVIARVKGEPAGAAQAIRREILNADSAQPVWNVQTMEETVNASLARERFTLLLMAIFAGVAFLLALIGLAGVMAYTISQRTQEIGIRMAVGARPWDVLVMIEKEALRLVGIGIGVGVVSSLVLSRSLSSLLYGTSAQDPWVFAGVALVFVVTAGVASWIPARRAAAIDPVETLRAG